MAIRVVEFSNAGYKIRKIFAYELTYQRKLLNFENWVNGEVSKIGHHFTLCSTETNMSKKIAEASSVDFHT